MCHGRNLVFRKTRYSVHHIEIAITSSPRFDSRPTNYRWFLEKCLRYWKSTWSISHRAPWLLSDGAVRLDHINKRHTGIPPSTAYLKLMRLPRR